MMKDLQFTTSSNRTEDENAFHRKRRAFLVYEDVIHYIPEGSDMSHFEQAQLLGIDKDTFVTLLRGYALNGDLYLYKGNFVYDKELVEYAKKFIPIFKKDLQLSDDYHVYFGLIIKEPGEIWPPDFQWK